MAAVIDLHTGQHLPDALELPQRPRRPELRVLPGGAAGGSAPRRVAVPSHRVFVLRRIAVAVVAAVVVLVLAQALGALAGAVAGAVDPVPADSGRVHVVAAGETAWDIAGSLAPSLERRVAVDDLLALNGDAPLQVGQELHLPASFG